MGTRKNSSQKEIKSVEEEAQRIREEYAYMDDMPLEGWMWEFIRRTKEYKVVSKLIDQNMGFRFDEQKHTFVGNREGDFKVENDIKEIPISETIGCAECVGCYSIRENKNPLGLNPNHFIITGYSSFYIRDYPYICASFGYPRAEIKYCEFDENNKPSIEGLDSIECLSAKELLLRANEHAEATEWIFEKIPRKSFIKEFNIPEPPKDELDASIDVLNFKYPSNLKNGLHHALLYEIQRTLRRFLRELTPTTLHDTIFIAISKTGKPDKILEQVEAIIKEQVKPRENRFSKAWKYQIIAYDLREKSIFSFPTIADIINGAFGKRYSYTEVRNDVYNRAVYMIDKDGYKEHLNRFDKNVHRRHWRRLTKVDHNHRK